MPKNLIFIYCMIFFENVNVHYDDSEDIGIPYDLSNENNDYLNAPISAPEIGKKHPKIEKF